MKMILAMLLITMPIVSSAANPPARRAQVQGYSVPAVAICKDEYYDCMYNCTVQDGDVCMPTKNSDKNCPERTIASGSWVSKSLVVLMFQNSYDMACHVISSNKTNLYCGNTKYGWECKAGALHNAD